MKLLPWTGAIVILLRAGVVFSSPDAAPKPDATTDVDVEAVVRATMQGGDTAAAMMATVDDSAALISPKMYRAIAAIEAYRRSVQRKSLTPDERVFDNYYFGVNARDKTMWLTPEERETCYEIVLWPRYRAGEKVMIDVPAKVGRSAVYVVRKSDFRVVRSQIRSRRP
jgi:hypothetical protein